MEIELNPLLLKISADQKLYPSHCIYIITLFRAYQKQNYITPYQISLRKLICLAKIRSITTYHKCIIELVSLGYILFELSYDSLTGSDVYLT
jgi:hypothetical protein